MIYHYTSFENFKNILKSKSLWLSSCMQMDDPIDELYSTYCVSRFMSDSNNGINDRLSGNLSGKDIINILKKHYFEYYSISFGVTNDNDTLWENYANNSKGICIAFDEKIIKNFVNKVHTDNYYSDYLDLDFVNVEYGYNINKLYNSAINIIESELEDVSKNDFLSYFAYRMTGRIKSEEWKDQKETRLLLVDDRKLTKRKLKNHKDDNNTWCELEKISFEEKNEILKKLGLLRKHKGHYVLDLRTVWDNNLLPKIFVRDENTYAEVKKTINKYKCLKNINVIKLQ